MKEEHKNTINNFIRKIDGMLNKLEDILAEEYNALDEITDKAEKEDQERKASMLDDIIMNFNESVLDLEDLINNR